VSNIFTSDIQTFYALRRHKKQKTVVCRQPFIIRFRIVRV